MVIVGETQARVQLAPRPSGSFGIQSTGPGQEPHALLRERGIVSRVTSRGAIPVGCLIGSFGRSGRLSADRVELAGPPRL